MINPQLHLNPKLFDEDVAQKAIRDGYGEGLLLAGAENPSVVVLTADVGESTRTEGFAKKYPKRFFEVGVAEQGMATIAAGLGISGKIPFISSYATFSPGRNWEQIRTTICYNDANVKIAGHHAGISTGPDGATHQATEDIAMMRALPNMKVIVPCDAEEAKKATVAAAKVWGPVYLRFGREKTPVITTGATPFVPGKAEVFWESKRPVALIVACGALVARALFAASALAKEKVEVTVLNVHTIKPLDKENILRHAERAGAVVSVEEHQMAGGLGGAVAELLAKRLPLPMEFVGMEDVFGESGPAAGLLERYGMSEADIIKAVHRAIKRK